MAKTTSNLKYSQKITIRKAFFINIVFFNKIFD